MVFINQKPRYSRTDGDRGFVFCTIPAFPRSRVGTHPGRSVALRESMNGLFEMLEKGYPQMTRVVEDSKVRSGGKK